MCPRNKIDWIGLTSILQKFCAKLADRWQFSDVKRYDRQTEHAHQSATTDAHELWPAPNEEGEMNFIYGFSLIVYLANISAGDHFNRHLLRDDGLTEWRAKEFVSFHISLWRKVNKTIVQSGFFFLLSLMYILCFLIHFWNFSL